VNDDQGILFEPIPRERLECQSKEDLIKLIKLQDNFNKQILRDNERLRALNKELEQKSFFVDDQLIVLKNKIYGKSSEREPKKDIKEKALKEAKENKTKVQLPSLRYPNVPLIERGIELKELPKCKCCESQMEDSGMTEDSEYLTVIPAQYLVIRQKRHKYRCKSCHGDLVTAPAPKRIYPGSSYSDEMIQDVALSKYCDLIPIERYAAIAGRAGLKDLPPQSLIETTHKIADLVEPVYEELKKEVLESKVLHADETPHRMLEGDKKNNWFLWGFCSKKTSYFEIHDTRSGDIASELLKLSKAEYLVSDVYSGYGKAVRETNIFRDSQKKPRIKNIYCNAHARRKFKDAKEKFSEEALFFIEKYQEIYHIEDETKNKTPEEILEIRSKIIPFFTEMKNKSFEIIKNYSEKSTLVRGINYFLKNYNELIAFTLHPDLPIDNNPQERLLRNPVVGRKTWYGTHSRRGAQTAAILFSLVESCKLNKINPREYFKYMVKELLDEKKPLTPAKYINDS